MCSPEAVLPTKTGNHQPPKMNRVCVSIPRLVMLSGFIREALSSWRQLTQTRNERVSVETVGDRGVHGPK